MAEFQAYCRRMSNRSPAPVQKPPLQIIRKPALRQRLGGCSDHHLDDLEAKENFPRRVRLARRSVGWFEHEVDRWLEDRMRARDELAAAKRLREPDYAPPDVRNLLREQQERRERERVQAAGIPTPA
jgi:prophage regulatory protein